MPVNCSLVREQGLPKQERMELLERAQALQDVAGSTSMLGDLPVM